MNKLILICLSVCMFAACTTVSYTRRQSLILIPLSEEIALGEEAFAQVRASSVIATDDRAHLIQSVGNRIAEAANEPKFRWEFILIEDDQTINAFCLPGGKVAFYTGILPLCKDENGIAVVMGHEIAHAVARHGAERMSQGMVTGLVGNALASAVSNKTPEAQQVILSGYGLSSALGVMLPFSRKHEYEADYIGLILMAKAGYDPKEAVNFWKRMHELSGKGAMPEFLSTHPNDEKRIAEIERRIPEVMQHYKPR